MRGFKPDSEGVDVTLLGSFNPQIYQPAWFASEKLMRPDESQKAEISVVHSQVVNFSAGWFTLYCTQERFVLATQHSHRFEAVRDLALGVFRLLRHTPIGKLGLNRRYHLALDDVEKWNAFGDLLAPKGIWSGVLEKPGMSAIGMKGLRTDGREGSVNVRVEPSNRVHPGIYVSINDHYECADPPSPAGCSAALEAIESGWERFISDSDRIMQALFEKTK